LTPVGVIHSEHAEPKRTPIQPVCAQGSAGRVEVFDLRVGTRGGWTEDVSTEEFVRRGERRPGDR